MKSLLGIILFPLSFVYQILILIRNALYCYNIFKATKLPCNVISVGNITTGGAGKTPTVIALAEYFSDNYKSVAILSRGYGRTSKGTQLVTDGTNKNVDWKLVGDEPALMANRLNKVPIVVDEKRVRGGQYLVEKFNPDIIILDDGFQHRKLFRDIDIVLINKDMPSFYETLFSFPAYRESSHSLKRTDVILLSKSNLSAVSSELRNQVLSYNKLLFDSRVDASTFLIDQNGHKLDSHDYMNKTAIIFSGIGDPDSFRETVKSLNIAVVGSIEFRDHYKYSDRDINNVKAVFNKNNADIILTTEKDLVKIDCSDLPIYAIPISVAIPKRAMDKIAQLFN